LVLFFTPVFRRVHASLPLFFLCRIPALFFLSSAPGPAAFQTAWIYGLGAWPLCESQFPLQNPCFSPSLPFCFFVFQIPNPTAVRFFFSTVLDSLSLPFCRRLARRQVGVQSFSPPSPVYFQPPLVRLFSPPLISFREASF